MTEKKKVSVDLETNDIEIVQELAAMYDTTFSWALRRIIREWAQAQGEAEKADAG